MSFSFGPRRAVTFNVTDHLTKAAKPEIVEHLTFLDTLYRSLCAMLYNYVPGSGHPGGSISSGRFVQTLLFQSMDYDLSNPDMPGADIISYAAGHKALGLYSIWALRNEIARVGNPRLLPEKEAMQFRFEDLLGFRRNPTADTPLFKKFHSHALDGHPTPATPFIKLSTGASGVGVSSSIGLAFAARDIYRNDPPRVHIIEGEGGLTPGRVAEALAGAGTLGLNNLIMHIDWNQASIDSNQVCRDGDKPGDYVQWNPAELAYLHDWNVIEVPDGFDYRQITAAQNLAFELNNGQPTAVVYRTVKGWKYGIEGRASHGAGHKLCSDGFFEAIDPALKANSHPLPCCNGNEKRCHGSDAAIIESCFWDALQVMRGVIEREKTCAIELAGYLAASKERLSKRKRAPHSRAPHLEVIYDSKRFSPEKIPQELILVSGSSATLRDALGNMLQYLNKETGGAFLAASADLLGSTSLSNIGKGFPEGFLDFRKNPDSRLFAMGGICEDAMSGVLAGLSTYGWHIGVGSSYGAFIAALGHIAARLHGIGSHARRALVPNEPWKTFILICAHAGLKTGEDGPTHADPQPLQILQENFPRGIAITLTPWDPQEMWPLVMAALQLRPAVLAPFVTRPSELVIDRAKAKLCPVTEAIHGVYALRKADPSRRRDGTLVLQESGVTYAFVQQALSRLDDAGYNLNVFYVASAELFDLLPHPEQARIFPEEFAQEAMGITGFTMPTMHRWIRSDFGRMLTMHPFMHGHYLGSGQAAAVLLEAGLDGESQFRRITDYVRVRRESAERGDSPSVALLAKEKFVGERPHL